MLHISYLYRIHTVPFLLFRAYNTGNQLIMHSVAETAEKDALSLLLHFRVLTPYPPHNPYATTQPRRHVASALVVFVVFVYRTVTTFYSFYDRLQTKLLFFNPILFFSRIFAIEGFAED